MYEDDEFVPFWEDDEYEDCLGAEVGPDDEPVVVDVVVLVGGLRKVIGLAYPGIDTRIVSAVPEEDVVLVVLVEGEEVVPLLDDVPLIPFWEVCLPLLDMLTGAF